MFVDSTSRTQAVLITLEAHPQKKNRLVITFEGDFWREVDRYFFQKHMEALQGCQNHEELQTLFLSFEKQHARLFALRKISQQSISERTLADALKRRLITPETIEAILAELREKGYLNDAEWAKQYAASLQRKSLGPRAIAQKLAFKGIGKETIQAAVGTGNGQEEAILALLNTRYRSRNLKDPKERQKVIASLFRRGFEFEAILSSLPDPR